MAIALLIFVLFPVLDFLTYKLLWYMFMISGSLQSFQDFLFSLNMLTIVILQSMSDYSRGFAAAREPGIRPRAPAFPRRLVAGEAHGVRLSRTLQGTALPLLLPSGCLRLLSALGLGRARAEALFGEPGRPAEVPAPAFRPPPPACVCWAC